jgi:hypothetical protein
MLKPGDIAIVSAARTPFGRYCGKQQVRVGLFKKPDTSPAAKASVNLAAVTARPKPRPFNQINLSS